MFLFFKTGLILLKLTSTIAIIPISYVVQMLLSDVMWPQHSLANLAAVPMDVMAGKGSYRAIYYHLTTDGNRHSQVYTGGSQCMYQR